MPQPRPAFVTAGVAVLSSALLLARAAPAPGAATKPSRPLLAATTDRGLRADVKFLADDLLEGRAPSTHGGTLAAQYVATRFKLLGLRPGGEGGTYYQQVTIVESRVDASAGVTVAGGGGAADHLKPTDEVVTWTGIEEPDVTVDADVV